MSAAVLLDAGPLGILSHPKNPPPVVACRAWAQALQSEDRSRLGLLGFLPVAQDKRDDIRPFGLLNQPELQPAKGLIDPAGQVSGFPLVRRFQASTVLPPGEAEDDAENFRSLLGCSKDAMTVASV